MVKDVLTPLLVALIGAGLLNFVRDGIKALRARRERDSTAGRQAAHVSAVDQSLLVVVKARDELAEDNERLRAMLAQERQGRAEDNERAAARERAYREEIEALETRVRAILSELEALRTRHAPGD
ncbi:hypothetical protein [Kineococcus esterisolvens]|uniref:hypothetical protein n=1 Tax=unclassified Kineococcus TaxID=2621656 RepID=UPI003D7C860E